MALIKCPECGKEISDKAGRCPHCGYPINSVPEYETNNMRQQNTVEKSKKVSGKKLILLLVGIVAIVSIGCAILVPKKIEANKKAVYNEALALLEKGKYEDGIEMLNTICGYKDVDDILVEAKYESYAYSAVNAVKKILKNPDSISVYEVKFYEKLSKSNDDTADDTENETENTDVTSENTDNSFPCVVLHIGAQNGFGGNTTSYAYCMYDLDEETYGLGGFTNKLDVDELDKDDDNYFYYYLSAKIIEEYLESGKEVGQIDNERFNAVLKNAAYSSIKIIE